MIRVMRMVMIMATSFRMQTLLMAKPLMMMVSGDDYENQTGIMMMIMMMMVMMMMMTMKARLK